MSNEQDLKDSLINIGSETIRLQKVFEKAMSVVDMADRAKYMSQFNWFVKKVTKALDAAGITILNLEGHLYDPGMAVTPLNMDEFDVDDMLMITQMMEPIVMEDGQILKTGTVILGRMEK